MHTEFDKRMKAYEALTDQAIPRELPLVIRLDGKAFHTWTRKFGKPFDPRLTQIFSATAIELAPKIQKCGTVYFQSDEISFIVRNDLFPDSDPWLGNRVQKIASISTSMFTGIFNEKAREILGSDYPGLAFFDGRVYPMPRPEILNYLRWRQIDCKRNAVLGYAQHYLGKKACQNKTIEILLKELEKKNISPELKHLQGHRLVHEEFNKAALYPKKDELVSCSRSRWVSCIAPDYMETEDEDNSSN